MGKKERKKINKAKKNKARTKLIIIISIAIIFSLGSIGMFSYYESYKILTKKTEVTTGQMVSEINRSLTNFLEGVENQTKALNDNSSFAKIASDSFLYDLEEENRQKKTMMEILRNVGNSDEDIIGTYMGTYDGDMYIYPEQALPDGFDPRVRPWYEKAKENIGQVIWTEPYADASSGNIIISAAKAIVKNGEVTGVVAIDINLKDLSKSLAERVVGENGYVFVVTEDGKAIAHNDTEEIGEKNITGLDIWNNISSEEFGFGSYTYDGKDKYLSFVTNDRTGWKLIISMEERELLKDANVIRNATIISLLIGVVIAVLISYGIASYISKPLMKLKYAFNKVSEGDLTTTVEINRNDEFGDIGQSFNGMLKDVSKLISSIGSSSDTVLTTSEALTEITQQTSISTEEVASAMEEIASSAGEQARDIENGAEQISIMAEKTENVTTLNNNMNDIATEAGELSNKGIEIVKLLTEKSKENSNSILRINDVIKEVDQSSEEIGDITNTISEISEQTNLLALNAAIEAARVGQHGKGFAVVAEEIRKLAEESSDAASKVKNLIDKIQMKSKTAVGAVEGSKRVVQEQDEAVRETEEIFTEITNSIINIVDLVSKVKENSLEMQDNKNEIVAIIGNLSATSEETSASTEEVTASTEEQSAAIQEIDSYSHNLKKLADNLKETVNEFKIKNN